MEAAGLGTGGFVVPSAAHIAPRHDPPIRGTEELAGRLTHRQIREVDGLELGLDGRHVRFAHGQTPSVG